MKLLAGLLISISLVLGTIAGASAYLPKVSSIDPADRLLLSAPAGVHPDDPTAPLLDPMNGPVVLTAETLAALAEANVKRVRVKSFAFKRWSHGYLFLLSCVGLIIGAILIRREARREVAASVESENTTSPEALLRDALRRVQELRQAIPNLEDAAARAQIVDRLDAIARKELDGVVQARPQLIGRLGLSGYARLMDRFAAAERQLNRAWSAAADHVIDESADCLAEGEARLREALQRLQG
jgi:hypothetical protein